MPVGDGMFPLLKAMAMLLYFDVDIRECVFCRIRQSSHPLRS
jgi:hypothetical protein